MKNSNGIIEGEELYKISVLVRNQNKYLKIAKQELKEENYLKLEKTYLEFATAFTKYQYTAMDRVLNGIGQTKSLQEHKINPYISAGIGGLYAGIASANRNSRIDQNREYWSNEVSQSDILCTSTKSILLSITEQLDKLLNLSNTIKKDRAEALLEEYKKEEEKRREEQRKNLLLLYISLGIIIFIFIIFIVCTMLPAMLEALSIKSFFNNFVFNVLLNTFI